MDLDPWLTSLLDSSAHFGLSLRGLAGRLRIPSGWHVQFDSLDNHLFYYVAEGHFEAMIHGRFQRVQAGDLLWSMRGAPIQFRLIDADSVLVWRFRLEALDGQGRALLSPAPQWHLEAAQSCEAWFTAIVEEAACTEPWTDVRLRGLLICLLTEMKRLKSRQSPSAGFLTPAQRETVARHFASHAAEWPAPTDLAALIGLSPDYFSRCFRRTFGMAPRQWLVRERMRLAAVHLLESQLRVGEVARELGYEDVFLFSRQFKAHFGMSPLDFRRTSGAVVTYDLSGKSS